MSSNHEFKENSKRLGIEQIVAQKDFVIEDDDPPPKLKISNKARIDRMGDIVEWCDHKTAVEMLKREFSSIPIPLVVDMVRTIQHQADKIEEQHNLIWGWKRAYRKQEGKMRKLEVALRGKESFSGYYSS